MTLTFTLINFILSRRATTIRALAMQILFSDWYAHYKFFWQYQIDWVDEQKKFKLFRDKLPLSFMFWMVVLLGGVVVYVGRHWGT